MKNLKLIIARIAAIALLLLFLIITYEGIIKNFMQSSNAEEEGKRALISISRAEVITKIRQSNQIIEPVIAQTQALPVVKPIEVEAKPSKITIIVSGLALSKSFTEKAFELPSKVVFGFSPYAAMIKEFTERARKENHEILVNLPLEPINYPVDDPGPLALLSNLNDHDNLERINEIFSRIGENLGVYTIEDERFTQTKSVVPILAELKKRELNLVYGGAEHNLAFLQIAKAVGFNPIIIDSIIDKEVTEDSILASFFHLEELAKKNNHAVGMISPYPISINLLKNWLATFDSKKLTLSTLKELQE